MSQEDPVLVRLRAAARDAVHLELMLQAYGHACAFLSKEEALERVLEDFKGKR